VLVSDHFFVNRSWCLRQSRCLIHHNSRYLQAEPFRQSFFVDGEALELKAGDSYDRSAGAGHVNACRKYTSPAEEESRKLEKYSRFTVAISVQHDIKAHHD
jgi:hypothetical protein